jgi:proteic killer suppression protein
VIKEYHDRLTALLLYGRVPKGMPPDVVKAAKRKLLQLDNAKTLADLRIPPGNQLEALIGDRAGQFSIRVNDRWRICFKWKEGDAYRVEFCDYH